MFFQKRDDFLKRFPVLVIHRLLFQRGESVSGLLFVLAVFKNMPDAPEEGAQRAHFLVGFQDLGQLLSLFVVQPVVGFEEQMAMLPQAGRQRFQLLLIPGRGDGFAS